MPAIADPLAEDEPAYLSAALYAISRAGFSIDGVALRSEPAIAQISARNGLDLGPDAEIRPEAQIKHAVQEYLNQRGEPAPYIHSYAAAVLSLLKLRAFHENLAQSSADGLAQLHAEIHKVFIDRSFLVRYGGGDHSLESGLWWHGPRPTGQPCLADRVEMETVRFLQKNPGCTLAALDRSLCALNPGLLTPSLDLIRACLDSYAAPDPADPTAWTLRAQDNPLLRRSDLEEANHLLRRLGERLNYSVEGDQPLLWVGAGGEPAFAFYPIASTLIGRFVFSAPYPADRCVVVLPGSRSNLMAIKLRLNPALNQAVSRGWRFLKFRHLRSLADNPLISRETWAMQLDTDPPEYKAAQMNMF